MNISASSNKLLFAAAVLLSCTALLVVALWGNKYAGYYVAWILLITFFAWQARR